jgi:Carboxypeptidase regulatory-like domain
MFASLHVLFRTSFFARTVLSTFSLLLVVLIASAQSNQTHRLAGRVIDPQSTAVANAHITLTPRDTRVTPTREATSDSEGRFVFLDVPSGTYTLTAEISSFAPATTDATITAEKNLGEITLQFREVASLRQAVTVTGSSAPSALTPDPSEHVVVHDQVLDANPGRPGVPVSIPGLPVETASGGIKAPQYFAPGVAGDHGEPIAQFYQIGDFLYPKISPPTLMAMATPIPIF